jgi:hypothetical protein
MPGSTAEPEAPSRAELEAHHCWEPVDAVPGRPAMTAFRRRARLHQARWREARGLPIGTQRGRPVGSRLALDDARATGATFLTRAARAAATARLATKERHQRLDAQRFVADLLSPEAFACNVFADVTTDAVRTWWPDTPGTVRDVRFQHSPGRLDRAFLGNLSTLGAAIELDLGDGTIGVLGVATPYHAWAKPEIPKPENLDRYLAVADRSGAFAPGELRLDDGTRSPFTVMWLTHLLVLSMLQHPSGRWRWGRLVVVHPAGNVDHADLAAAYRTHLADPSTFDSLTLESLLDAGALPARTSAALRRRYVVA